MQMFYAIVMTFVAAMLVWTAVMAYVRKPANVGDDFGDSRDAPYWPTSKLNGHLSLHRGVWVDDRAHRPSDRDLDRIRTEHHATLAATTERVSFDIPGPGEYMLPMGEKGALILVRVDHGEPATVTGPDGVVQSEWPTIAMSPVVQDIEAGTWWSSSSTGSLPTTLSFRVSREVYEQIQAMRREESPHAN